MDFYAALAMEKRRVALKQVAAMTSLPALWMLFCKVAHVQNHDVAWQHLAPAIALPVIFCVLYTVLWRVPEQRLRRAFLLLSLGSNLVVLGFRLNHNFRLPYFAQGPSDFWRRWHITLSAWFRDYVYIPLGGNRGGIFATLRNLGLTMVLAGLWQGANWTFILWGAYHGALLIIYRLVPPLHAMESAKSRPRVLLGTGVMFALTLIGWAIFRCGSLAQLGDWFAAFGHWQGTSGIGWSKPAIGEVLAAPVANVTVDWLKPALWFAIHALPLALLQFAARRSGDESDNSAWPWPVRGIVYVLMFLAIASSTGGEVEFIYFQF